MAVLATGVGHTVLSTFPICVCLFVCKYASWFTFTFKVAVMTIIGCNNVQYTHTLFNTYTFITVKFKLSIN